MFERRPTYFRVDDNAATGRRIEGTVKWFDAMRGFGFVVPNDGSPEAFLPMAALRRLGRDRAREGATIVCEVGPGAKGPLVINVLSLDETTAGSGAPAKDAPMVAGVVRWFEADKGFGFIALAGGGKDIFIHSTALRRSHVPTLAAGQHVRVAIIEGRKGPEAERVVLV